MNTHADKTKENKSQSVPAANRKVKPHSETTSRFIDNRPEAIAQRKLQEVANNSPQAKQAAQLQAMANNHHSQQPQHTIQKKENKTGLPDNLKSGIENLSGYSMDDVKVHRNSDKPAQLQAHAYAQGTNIHLGPGQEKHLPHEAWHVVQQKQGRVKPTMQMKGKVNINDDAGLEKEADVMGAKALLQTNKQVIASPQTQHPINVQQPVQRLMKKLDLDKTGYRKATMTTVFLYAEFNGKPVGANGLFKTEKGNHAEENLIAYIIKLGLENGNLVVYLSTSPCSSTFCTRDDGKKGCQERLEGLKKDRNISIKVHADHLYQPQALASQESEFEKGAKGLSSYSSAATSAFEMTFSSLPKKLSTPDMMDGFDEKVAQL
ncbi:DUF4157 domain-containing protein [Flavivirga amylovorans]|uniref:DUF4157 domain-containing protein n=1 Tax=Flavivirga amylovorans TaxID=870486 RepID=A0ABT8WYQ7_9FLAO|nr:DUF4157 domain-containing protein [Flavivirga amylovorans]MDO5986820.1 DUF4157 domain-containing protein [Flavivirga amylovorans]